jgi:CheY-like chemotaxis protein
VSRSKDEFIAVLSHELRTPLNAILGWVHVLKRRQTPTDLQRGLEAIERNSGTQTRLISDLLDVSRMDVGKLRLELEQVDAAEVVRSAAGALTGSAEDKGLRLVMDIGEHALPVLVDPARLQQIVWNLLTNAIKFTEPGGCISLRLASADDGGVRLTVEDDGQGIKPEFLPYLFDRFSQSDSASNRYHGGLGLGLSIVRHLVELHGGRIEVHSEGVNRGTRFVVHLPQRPPSALLLPNEDRPRTDTSDAASASASAAHADLSGLDILVVEDDAEAREMLSMVLRERGAQVRLANDQAQGMAAWTQAPPDVLVSDVGLPGKDGYEFIRELRRAEPPGRPRLPAIALTAFARPKDRELALDAGFDAHCAKPLQPHELIAAILKLARPAPRQRTG